MIINRNIHQKIFKNKDNSNMPNKLKTNSKGTKCLKETGIICVYLKGKVAHKPFTKLCLRNATNFEGGQ